MQLPEDKDPTIRYVLARLEADLGPGAFVIQDHWEQDLMAVGIACPHELGRLAFISTFGCAPERYDIELELPPQPGSDFPYSDGGRFWGVEYDALREITTRHLGN
jgi:hypothetical protein